MSRAASTILVLVLLGATAAAFALSERLKLQPSPIDKTLVTRVFSPTCNCRTSVARIDFALRRRQRLTVEVLDAQLHPLRRLVVNRRLHGLVHLRWNGRDAAGRVMRDGAYRIRVHLSGDRRTITLPNVVMIDTVRPRVTVLRHRRTRVISPHGTYTSGLLRVRYRVSKPAYGLLYVDGIVRVRGRLTRLSDKLEWYGRLGAALLPPGRYRVAVGARDLAGNLAAARPAGFVVLRYIAALKVVTVRVGAVVRIPVAADAQTYTWQLGSRRGVGRSGVLVLSALPAGRHVLRLVEPGAAATTMLIAR